MKARISYFKIAVVKIGAEILSYIQKQINVVAQSYDQKEKVREVWKEELIVFSHECEDVGDVSELQMKVKIKMRF